jgi:dTDP-4-amino-4,6-dideoxygalactose transaminase
MRPIRLVDLAAQNEEIRADVERSFDEIHRDTAYVGGPQVTAFEREFAAYLGVQHVVGVGSGTDALRLVLIAIGVGAGDEVITSPMTCIGTAEAIVQTGARPAFVDIDPVTCNMSAETLRRYLQRGDFVARNGPKAILPVHLYGMPAAMDELLDVADQYGLKIIEDACQAHGARMTVRGCQMHAGAIGAAGCFSFYPGKNLGAWGEAGAVATNDLDLATRVRILSDHGRISHYAHQECGYNARLDTLQAAVLSAKLLRLDRWNARRRELARTYHELLADSGILLPIDGGENESCYHLYVIRSERRDALRNALLSSAIECGIHYPVPLHLQPAFHNYGYRRGDFPRSEEVADTVLSLPMHPHLSKLDLVCVVEALHQGLSEAHNMFAGRHHELFGAWLPPTRGQQVCLPANFKSRRRSL